MMDHRKSDHKSLPVFYYVLLVGVMSTLNLTSQAHGSRRPYGYGQAPSSSPSLNLHTSSPWVGKAEDYFNRIKYLKTTFTQNNPDGSVSQGILYLSRPDKMRIEYKAPQKLTILSDGQYLIQYDPVLDESSRIDLEFTPASILLQDPVRFQGSLRILNITEKNDTVFIKVAKKGDEDQGSLTFKFKKFPFDLQGWTVIDSQGQIITLHLSDQKERPGLLDYSLFRFHRRR